MLESYLKEHFSIQRIDTFKSNELGSKEYSVGEVIDKIALQGSETDFIRVIEGLGINTKEDVLAFLSGMMEKFMSELPIYAFLDLR